MEVIKISPQGFCKGVLSAIIKIKKALEDKNIKCPIYMLGNIVHNKHIVEAFKSKGIIILDGKRRLELLDEINTSGTVIITAHGASETVFQKAKEKGLDIIDATCKDVDVVHHLIKEKIEEGYHIFFLGKLGHPETEGILDISGPITLVEENQEISQIPNVLSNRLILTNQTTMSYLDVIKTYTILKEKFPTLELAEEVCSATRMRQLAVMETPKDIELCIVVGDKRSNNTRMLKEVSKRYGNIEAITIEEINGLNEYDLSNYKKVAITSGASTPSCIVEEIIEALKTYDKHHIYQSKLTHDDYLKG